MKLITQYNIDDQEFLERMKIHQKGDIKKCMTDAVKCFFEALDDFKELNHLKG